MSDSERQQTRVEDLYWMLDAPFFIDAPQLAAFYDAVLQPIATKEESLRIEVTKERATELSGKFGAEFNPAQLATLLEPLIGASFNVGAGISANQTKKDLRTRTIEFKPIKTPQRQLIQLTVNYLIRHPDRIFFVSDLFGDRKWFMSDEIRSVPREVVFFDLPSVDEANSSDLPKTMLMPMAVEFSNGHIEPLYEQFDVESEDDSWAPYIEEFTPSEAVEMVETAARDQQSGIEWINFRLPLNDKKTARIHFEPNGEYSNGTFAYNLITLGYKHGLRLIGTVQAEPDVRVLAGYRK